MLKYRQAPLHFLFLELRSDKLVQMNLLAVQAEVSRQSDRYDKSGQFVVSSRCTDCVLFYSRFCRVVSELGQDSTLRGEALRVSMK